MAKFHLDRIRRKYGFTGERYRELLQQIIAVNSGNMARAMGRLSKEHYDKAAKKVSTKEQKFIVPDVSEVIPKRGVFARKAAIDGKRMTDKLRDRITKDLRDTMNQFTPKTGEATFLFRRGAKAGKVNPKLIDDFEGRIRKSFENYTKVDPSYGVPRNIHTIAVTEVRSVADEVKASYVEALAKKNPDFQIRKRWVHNKRLSENPRPHHMSINGQTVDWDDMFTLGNGVKMRYPHDPLAPAEEVISCHCDFDVLIQRLTRRG